MRSTLLLASFIVATLASSHQQPHGHRALARRAPIVKRSEAVKHERRSCSARNAKAQTSGKSASKSKSSKSSKSSSKGSKSSGKASNTTSSSNSSSSSSSISNSFLKINGIGVGMVPDEGDAGGSKQSMAQLNSAIGGKFATYGYYAQAQNGKTFDGSQLLAVKDDVVKSGAIFEAAVMPTGGFSNYGEGESQATAICNVMKEFTDAGVETRLRFAHECNFYITDGTYSGSLADCKASFTGVAQTCRKIAPKVKMFLTPNIDGNGLSTYKQMFPDDASLVDLVGIDFYPTSVDDTTFVNAHKDFHDFALSKNSKIQYGVAETGPGFAASLDQRLAWLSQMTNAATKKAMPALVSVSWFNFQKEQNFLIVTPSSSSAETTALKALSGLTGL